MCVMFLYVKELEKVCVEVTLDSIITSSAAESWGLLDASLWPETTPQILVSLKTCCPEDGRDKSRT